MAYIEDFWFNIFILSKDMDLNQFPFFSSFLSNLLASLVILVIGTFLIPIYLNWKNRPKLKLRSAETFEDKFSFTESSDKQWESSINLIVQNRGNKTMERFYWEMYIKKPLEISFVPHVGSNLRYNRKEIDGTNFSRFYGYVDIPIFPLESIDFPFEIKIKINERNPLAIYHFFKTDSGQYPFWSWLATSYNKFSLLKKLWIY